MRVICPRFAAHISQAVVIDCLHTSTIQHNTHSTFVPGFEFRGRDWGVEL